MIYIKLETLEFPRFQGDIRNEHPEIGEEFVCPGTYAPVVEGSFPEYDYETQKVIHGDPENVDGVWKVDFKIVPLSETELKVRAEKPKSPFENLIKDPRV